jgi:2-polyprenyl-3-methyl-5-hydroxy-6-metoxy-1,4-benzoquinol methylase/TPR repeat protein
MSGVPGPASNDAARIDGLYELAMRRHQTGELREAEELYRAILDGDPRQLDALHFLGLIALQSGRPRDAVDLIGKAIAANDKIAAYHGGIAEAYRVLGEPQAAVEHYRKAVALDPGYREAQHNLGQALLDHGDANEALDAAVRALVAQDTAHARSLLVQCIRSATSYPGGPSFRNLLTRAIAESWGRPVELTTAAIALINYSRAISAGAKLAMEAWPRRLTVREITPCLGPLVADGLLRAVLETTPLCDAGLERLLTSVRAMLLDAAVNATGDVSEGMIAFSCALARQCFINEYVFDVAGAEQQALTKLRATVADALALGKPVLAIHLIALSAYAPLHTTDRAQALADRTWDPAVATLMAEQIREPDEEAKLRASIPQLTPITDAVSVAVQRQYEENPYPRWVRTAPALPAAGIIGYLRAEFPLAPLRDRPEPARLDILVAGCGTGQQSIAAAQRFPNAHVLAIDLSQASLAYAMRKSRETGVTVEYGQADITGFAPTGQSFDVIEASGVLHHLADPMQGWSALLRLLKPGGFMRLGFYSDLARTDIKAAQSLISVRGIASTPDAIRRYRQEAMSSHDPRYAGIVGSPDFYSTSACRDLLFHVQEHRLTLPQIGAFLADNGLVLLGFELDAPILSRYRAASPDDPAAIDLANWHRFESENPAMFRGMYQFWVQKAS